MAYDELAGLQKPDKQTVHKQRLDNIVIKRHAIRPSPWAEPAKQKRRAYARLYTVFNAA